MKKLVMILLAICSMNSVLSQNKDISERTETYFDIVRPQFKGELALKTTAFVEKYWRVAGNEGFNMSIHRVVSELEKAGYVLEYNASPKDRFVYRIESRVMESPTWEPIDASLTILGESEPLLKFATNRNMIYQNSASTPLDGLIADLVYIESLEDLKQTEVKNKIIFTEASFYQMYRTAILKQGALGLITYNNPEYLQPEKNKTSIQFRQMPESGPLNHWAIALSYEAKEKLKADFSQGPVKLKVNIQTKIYPSIELTIVASIKGSELPNESLVFSAHVQEPGANDNATGVGTQLEIATVAAKLVADHSVSAKRTLIFLWGDEIVSTQRYIQEKEKRNSKINWGISLDMVGENTDLTGGTFLIEKMPDPSAIYTRGEDKHSEWGGQPLTEKDMKPHYLNDFIINTFKMQGAYANWIVNTNPFEGGSDHTPFIETNLPGLLLWHFTDQFYHTDNDRLDKVSRKTMQNVGTAALVSALTLINADENTALEMINTIENVAEDRLNTEFELSKIAIENGAAKKSEVAILNSWLDWYQKTLDSISDLDSTHQSNIHSKIKDAKTRLNQFQLNLVESLN